MAQLIKSPKPNLWTAVFVYFELDDNGYFHVQKT